MAKFQTLSRLDKIKQLLPELTHRSAKYNNRLIQTRPDYWPIGKDYPPEVLDNINRYTRLNVQSDLIQDRLRDILKDELKK